MKTRTVVFEEPKIIEGVLIRRDCGFAGGDVEISPTARVVAVVNGSATTYSLENYDRSTSFIGSVYGTLPERTYPRIRVTETRERETKRNDRRYVESGFVTAVVEDLDEGTKTENRFQDFVHTGYAFWNRIVRGTLEQLPQDQTREKLEQRHDNVKGVIVLGIRSLNGRHLIPVIFYANSKGPRPAEAYGHRVRFQEGVWDHDIYGLGHQENFDQGLIDLQTKKEYRGSVLIEHLSPGRLSRLKKQAKVFRTHSQFR